MPLARHARIAASGIMARHGRRCSVIRSVAAAGASLETRYMAIEVNKISRRDLIAGAAAGLALTVAGRLAVGGEAAGGPTSRPAVPEADARDGWAPASPRDEVRPEFA